MQRDERLCHIANRWGSRRPVLRFFGAVSRLGDGVFWYCLMALLLVTSAERGAQASLHMAVVGLIACALYRTLKRWTRRPRPFRRHQSIVAHVAPLDEFSFPSGHTLHAANFSTIGVAYFPELAVLLIPFATLVAMSRVILGLHYPSDVVAAIAIAGVLSGSSLWLVRNSGMMG